jgi:hypothetical protein
VHFAARDHRTATRTQTLPQTISPCNPAEARSNEKWLGSVTIRPVSVVRGMVPESAVSTSTQASTDAGGATYINRAGRSATVSIAAAQETRVTFTNVSPWLRGSP